MSPTLFCFYCSSGPLVNSYDIQPSKRLTYDHFLPKSKGGSNGKKNLVPCCWSCNHAKGNKTNEEWLHALVKKHDKHVSLRKFLQPKIDRLKQIIYAHLQATR